MLPSARGPAMTGPRIGIANSMALSPCVHLQLSRAALKKTAPPQLRPKSTAPPISGPVRLRCTVVNGSGAGDVGACNVGRGGGVLGSRGCGAVSDSGASARAEGMAAPTDAATNAKVVAKRDMDPPNEMFNRERIQQGRQRALARLLPSKTAIGGVVAADRLLNGRHDRPIRAIDVLVRSHSPVTVCDVTTRFSSAGRRAAVEGRLFADGAAARLGWWPWSTALMGQRAQPGHQHETVRLQSATARQRGVSSSTVSNRPYTLPSPPRTST